jgi:hypothetical protein
MTLEHLTCFGTAAFWIKIDTIVSLHPCCLILFPVSTAQKLFLFFWGHAVIAPHAFGRVLEIVFLKNPIKVGSVFYH